MPARKRSSSRDPDIVALIEAGGGLSDARTLVLNQAHKLNQLYRRFDKAESSPFDRLVQMASLIGFEVSPMTLSRSQESHRDAVVLLKDPINGRGGQIFYNPTKSDGRIAFSIAHEIAHTFFPSTSGGARFREMAEDSSSEGTELERLCDVGAAELLMPQEDFRAHASESWCISSVHRLAKIFGSSVEATLFRLASAYPGIAVAGSANFRLTKGDSAKLKILGVNVQDSLFSGDANRDPAVAPPKYRRQAFHSSEQAVGFLVPWNKSFDLSSCIYRIPYGQSVSATESLPNGHTKLGVLEAMHAPYQRNDADPAHPDVLFFWKASYAS